MLKLITAMALAGSVSTLLLAQTAYVPVNDPYAQNLLVATKNAHTELAKNWAPRYPSWTTGLRHHRQPDRQQDRQEIILGRSLRSCLRQTHSKTRR
jgi:hypothetical protein